ncbi:MAG: 4Fe-4S dicluster domain-containing protein [Synergistaceae bacterium]|jgi:heterodisulfide reductase subunit C|nr:4Fe-4S dicluster domain-containing protein [Synergistaceae bacterium]
MRVDNDDILRSSGTDVRKCMKCGKCSGACPSFDEMDFPPHIFVSMVERGDAAALLSSKSLWTCMSCFACVERCPRGVEPANVIEAVRASAMSPQGANRMRPEDVPVFLGAAGECLVPQQLLASAFRKYSR